MGVVGWPAPRSLLPAVTAPCSLLPLPFSTHNDTDGHQDGADGQRYVHPARCDVGHKHPHDPEDDQRGTYQQELHITSLDAISTIVYYCHRVRRAGGEELNY